ncbi:MAG: D,D-heptose 1,7-bisphosphate phosphatase, partial [Flavobacteriales bacterium]|nr:D,D-heptose 1,7-bisphosphate phosphatase [Flavobacteriales bacterium]
RDGVINKERGEYTFKITDFEINEGVFDFLKIAQNKGYEFVVITNQGGISKK